MPPWQIALSLMMAVVVMSLCLFPLAPYKLRLAVVYFFLGLLGVIFALIAIRIVLFVFVFTLSGAALQFSRYKASASLRCVLLYSSRWSLGATTPRLHSTVPIVKCMPVAGYEFWLFPNMLSDQVDIVGAFKPLLSFGKPEDGQSHWGTRIGGLVGTGLMIYMMYAYSPDERTIKNNLKAANENILDMFHSGGPAKSIGDGTGYQAPKFGAERNIDVGSIRQHMMNEKIRKRQEAAKAKAQGAEGGAEGSQGAANDSDAGSPESSDSEAASDPESADNTDVDSNGGQAAPEQEDAPHTEL